MIVGQIIGSVKLELDRPLVDTRLLIQANSGGGKSWLLRLIAERTMLPNLRSCPISRASFRSINFCDERVYRADLVKAERILFPRIFAYTWPNSPAPAGSFAFVRSRRPTLSVVLAQLSL
jgi:hypothetical protein